MSDSNCILGTRDEKVTLDIVAGGIEVHVIPSGPTVDASTLDVFWCGIRFTTLAKTVACLRSDRSCRVGRDTILISPRNGRLEFQFPCKDDSSMSYTLELDETNSLTFLDFCESALYGKQSASGNGSPQQLKAARAPRRNDPCPCGSGKKFKKCCAVKLRSNAEQPTVLPAEMQFAELSSNEALLSFVEQMRENPRLQFDTLFWNEFAIVANNEDNSQLAIQSLRRVIRMDPNDFGARANLAAVLGSAGQLDEALIEIDTVPDDRISRKWIVKANILQELERHEQAIECYEKAIREEPDFFLPYARILNSLKRIGSPLYEFWLLRGCDAVPTSAWMGKRYCHFMLTEGRLHQLASAEWLEGLMSEAGRFDLIGFSQDDPRLIIECQLLRLVARIHCERDPTLLSEAMELLKSTPRGADICDAAKLLTAAAAYFGDQELVEESFSCICPSCRANKMGLNGPLTTYLATASHATGDYQNSVEYARRALIDDENNLTSLWLLWWGLDELGQSKEALETAEFLWKIKPDYPDLLYSLGFLSGKEGRFGRASFYYGKCLEIVRRHWMAAENLAFVELAQRDIDKADVAWKDFVDIRRSATRQELLDIMPVEGEKDEELSRVADILSLRSEVNDAQVAAKQLKFEDLREFATSNMGSESYVHDLETRNFSSAPFIGAQTAISKLRLDTKALLEAIDCHSGPNHADAKFYLAMQQRRDLSVPIASIAGELPKWRALTDAGQSSLLEAENRFLASTTIDHAPCIGAYAKAVEIMLFTKVFEQFRVTDGICFQQMNSIQAMAFDKSNKAYRFAAFVAGGFPLELGSMHFVLSLCTGRTAQETPLLGSFRNFIACEIELSSMLDKTTLDSLSTLVTEYRNPATHARAFGKSDAAVARRLSYDLLRQLLQCEPYSDGVAADHID